MGEGNRSGGLQDPSPGIILRRGAAPFGPFAPGGFEQEGREGREEADGRRLMADPEKCPLFGPPSVLRRLLSSPSPSFPIFLFKKMGLGALQQPR